MQPYKEKRTKAELKLNKGKNTFHTGRRRKSHSFV